MGDWFEDDDAFPLIARLIESICAGGHGASRDDIARAIIEDSIGSELVNEGLRRSRLNEGMTIAGKMVDWFSAEISKQSRRTAAWNNTYYREKVRRPRMDAHGRSRTRAIWQYRLRAVVPADKLPEEIDASLKLVEGATRQVTVNAYERNPAAREACIAHHGHRCTVCDFDFENAYGEIGQGYIQVHHLTPLGEIRAESVVDPIVDMRPVCPNCHAMIHRRVPAMSIDELKGLLTCNE